MPRPKFRPWFKVPTCLLALIVVCTSQFAGAVGALANLQSADLPSDSLVLTGPGNLSATITPGDLSNVKQGDRVRIKVTGIEPQQAVDIGTCPAALAEKLDQLFLQAYGHNCSAPLPTGIGGDTGEGQLGASASTVVKTGWAQEDGSVTVDFLIGRGESLATMTNNYLDFTTSDPYKFSCDEENACSIGISVSGTAGFFWTDITSLKISPKDPSTDQSGCSGLGAATVSAFGPERMQKLMTDANRGFCGAEPGPLPVSYVGLGESEQLAAVGQGKDLALAGSPLLARNRPANTIAIPIAINAVALGQFGGKLAPSNTPEQFSVTPTPISSLAVDPEDLAGIVLHNYGSGSNSIPPTEAAAPSVNPIAGQLKSRPGNAQALAGFDPSLFGLPLNRGPAVTYSLGPDSTAIALSRYLNDRAKSQWVFPKQLANDQLDRSGKPVGLVDSFDQIKDSGVEQSGPQLTSQVSSVGGLFSAIFSKDLDGIIKCPVVNRPTTEIERILAQGCLRFAVLDSATAAGLSLTTSKLQQGDDYIPLSTESLQSAASGDLDSAGFFPEKAGAYPLSFVEYAVVPASALVDDKCVPRAAQQKELVDFLRFITGPGQKSLPAGFAALPEKLQQTATSALTQVGKGAAIGKCAAKTPAKPGGTGSGSAKKSDPTPTGSVAGVDSDSGSGSNSSGSSSDAGPGVGSGTSGSADPGTGPLEPVSNISNDAQKVAAAQPVAAPNQKFAGFLDVSTLRGLVGLLLLIGLTSMAALLGGRSYSELLAELRRKVTS